MQKISDFEGVLLNHFEAVYRPGERAIAMEFTRALGLVTEEVYFTKTSTRPLVAVHPNEGDKDRTSNVFYLHEMQPAQAKLDGLVRERLETDPELREAMEEFRETVRTRAGGTPHFGIRYRSHDAVDTVIRQLEHVSPELKERVTVREMPAVQPIEGIPDIRQVFVFTDVMTASAAGYGQLIELQVLRNA